MEAWEKEGAVLKNACIDRRREKGRDKEKERLVPYELVLAEAEGFWDDKTPRAKDYSSRLTEHNYDAVPKVPTYTVASKFPNPLIPEASGIYFAWEQDAIAYIGLSFCLRNRLTLNHERIRYMQKPIGISVILIKDRRILTWAESYYIGICRPWLNGGTHRNWKMKLEKQDG